MLLVAQKEGVLGSLKLTQAAVSGQEGVCVFYLYGTGHSHPHTCHCPCPSCWRPCCCGTAGNPALCSQCNSPQTAGSCLFHCSGWIAGIGHSVCYLPSPAQNRGEEISPIRMVMKRLQHPWLYTYIFTISDCRNCSFKAKELSRAKHETSKSYLHWYCTICRKPDVQFLHSISLCQCAASSNFFSFLKQWLLDIKPFSLYISHPSKLLCQL